MGISGFDGINSITFVKNLISLLLSILFPRERRTTWISKLTSAELEPLMSFQRKIIGDSEVSVLFNYTDPPIRDLIWTLKYEGNKHAANLCGTILADVLLERLTEEQIFDVTVPLLIPVPLSPKREHERGYNQVLRIAEHAIPLLHNKTELAHHVLKRTRHTPQQTSLSKLQRQDNLKGAFAVSNSESVKGRTCILLDDVVTTGSTLAEAGRTLTQAGAKSVEYWAIAAAGK